MNHPIPPPSKSHPANQATADAELPGPLRVVGASKVVAEGVRIGSDPHQSHHLRPLLNEGEAA